MKNKIIITGLATATLLTVASLNRVTTNIVAAEEPATEITKEDIAEYFTSLESDAEKEINANDKITDKAKALEDAKKAIGKDDLLKAIDNKEITPTEIMKDLAASSNHDSEETTPETKPQVVKDATKAPGEVGNLKDSKPVDGNPIPEDVKEKILKRLEEEKVDVKDVEERITAAKEAVKVAEEKLNNAKTDKEKAVAKEDLESYKKDLEIEEKRLNDIQNDLGVEKLQNLVADLERELSKLEDELNTAIKEGAKDKVIIALQNKINTKKAEFNKVQKELDLALYGVKPLVHTKPSYDEPLEYPTSYSKDLNLYKNEEKEIVKTMNPSSTNEKTREGSLAKVAETKQEKNDETKLLTSSENEMTNVEEKKKAELPKTGTAELGVFTPAVLSILAGLGLVTPFSKKRDK